MRRRLVQALVSTSAATASHYHRATTAAAAPTTFRSSRIATSRAYRTLSARPVHAFASSSSSSATASYGSCCSVSLSTASIRKPPFASVTEAQRRFSSVRTRPVVELQMAEVRNSNKSVSGEEMLAFFPRKKETDIMVGQNIALAMKTLAQSDCVCFDVDSTVIMEEGIDVLADYLGRGEEVAAMTKQAMEGGMKFQDALAARLNLLQPSKPAIVQCLQQHPLQLTPGVQEFIQALQTAGKDVYLVSGGFRIMIEPVAEILNIPVATNIIANTILFDKDGNYAGFDANEPTSRDMGKPKALQSIRTVGNYKCMIMIGDGATDAQAKPPATAFIGFGGIAVREKVKQVADWFVTDFTDLTHIVTTYCNKK